MKKEERGERRERRQRELSHEDMPTTKREGEETKRTES
jgi:hypothetical protein